MKRIIALVIAVGLAALLFVAPSDVDLEWPDAAQPTAPAASDNDPAEIIPVPADAIPMRVESITDGDTLKLSTDQPGDLVTTTRPIAVRLIGIDTPEVYPQLECYGTEAEDELARLAPLGSTLWVAPDEDSWDDYDRRLFYLWTNDGEFINLSLVEGGFAEAIRVAPNDLHYETLLAAERDAALAGLGMWGECSSR
ncbi:MAG: hypothetical protein CMF56_09145 [Leifsonia sp.]|nr:hypothetical protein [Leifsonia sp.]